MKFLGRFTKAIGVALIVIFCALSILLSFVARDVTDYEAQQLVSYASSLENKFYDYRVMKITEMDPEKKNKDIILIKVDDESLQKLNSWPIPRENWVKLLDNLKAFGAKVAAFDVFFPEPSRACSEESPDDMFANAIENFQSIEGNRVIMAYTTQSHKQNDVFNEVPEDLFSFMLDSQQAGEAGLEQRYVEQNTYPIKKLLAPAPDMAYINMLEDSDGVFRHYQMVANIDMLYFPSLGLRAYEVLTQDATKLEVNNQGTGQLNVGEHKIFVNNRGESKIRWFGNEYMFENISLHEVIYADPNDEKLKNLFNGKIAFIGSTATGAHDFRNSPIDAKMPGVLAHMNVLHMLMNQHFYAPLDQSIIISLYMLGAGLLLLLIIMYFNIAIMDIAALVVIGASILWIDYQFYLPNGYELKLFFTLTALGMTYSWITFLNFNQASAEKKQIKGAFSRYVAPAIVNDMLEHPDKLKVGGEKRDITCLFSDVRDFTSISEQLTPVDLAWALNRYMGKMTDIVFETNGTLDKYIGDAIVAFWGAPLDIGDHVTQAVGAAVDMLEALPAVNAELKAKGLPEFKIGLGLNSGECSVGNMGSDQIFAYTALGDTMNLGARLESLCKHYGAQILISEFTHDKMEKNKFETRLIDRVRVKGKTEPVAVYEVLYSYHPLMVDQDSLAQFKLAYQRFIEKDFDNAIALFEMVQQAHPEDASTNRLVESCRHWIKNPPKEGEDHTITTMTTK
ncbi:MAG: adenylate/guanylate cyclase domain-containing protein [Bacteriovoracaceae bacterium]|nr:adenylate/guanylate cyclase domain-containing protein [Bacteriovoracaceae bacterium]